MLKPDIPGLTLFCLCCCFTPKSTIFQSCLTISCLLGLNQYSAEDKGSCSRTEHSAFGESQINDLLYHNSTTEPVPSPKTVYIQISWILRSQLIRIYTVFNSACQHKLINGILQVLDKNWGKCSTVNPE